MPVAIYSIRPTQLAELLQLAAVDARIRQAERSELEIQRTLAEHQLGLETLARFIDEDRRRALAEASDAKRRELERRIVARGEDAQRVRELLTGDQQRSQPLLERLRQTVVQAQEQRREILRALGATLALRYETLIKRGILSFIVALRDGHCGGCALRLAGPLVEHLHRHHALAHCPRCGRMVHGRGPVG